MIQRTRRHKSNIYLVSFSSYPLYGELVTSFCLQKVKKVYEADYVPKGN